MSKRAIENIIRFGVLLEAPSRILLARVAFAKLRSQVKKDRVLVAIHGDGASSLPELGLFKGVLDDFPAKDIRYYSIPRDMHLL